MHRRSSDSIKTIFGGGIFFAAAAGAFGAPDDVIYGSAIMGMLIGVVALASWNLDRKP